MSSIKGIIFDYGGTIDTDGIHWGELIGEEYDKAGIGIGRGQYREAYVHGERSLAKSPIIEPTDTFHTLLKKKITLQFEYLSQQDSQLMLTQEQADKIADACYARVNEALALTRGIVQKLAERYPMVLVTNFYGNMPVVLEEFGLTNYFNSIIESSVVGLRKPDPSLFALGVKALGVEADEIVVIGDSYRKDIYPSSTLGCRTVWLKKVCWEEEPIVEGHAPTATIESLAQLPDIINTL
jgi:putative hydrolase of the HAD superfamily